MVALPLRKTGGGEGRGGERRGESVRERNARGSRAEEAIMLPDLSTEHILMCINKRVDVIGPHPIHQITHDVEVCKVCNT
jgi:hypothetical protein